MIGVTVRRLILLVSLFSLALAPSQMLPIARQTEAVIAYIFPGDRILQPNEISAEKVTRINYAFANLRDGEVIEGFAHDADNFATLNSLKANHPQLQLLISVGGWTWSGGFSDMARTAASRRRFVVSAMEFIARYHLDGIDIDWEYPGLPGNGNPFRPQDKENYTALFQELRAALNRAERLSHRHLLLSLAAGASEEFLAHTSMGQVAPFVDSVNLMSYDFYEPGSSTTTGHHAPLFTNPADPRQVSADASVRDYLAAGVPARKLMLGVPFYGHAWSKVPETAHGLFQPGKRADIPADYRSIVASLLGGGYVRYWDAASSAPYLYNPATRIFVSYEDPESIEAKAQYVTQHHLGGIMFWEYGGDSDGALLNAIDAGLQIQPAPR